MITRASARDELRPAGRLVDVVAELAFAEPVAIGDLAALERACEWCFEAHRVEIVRVFLAHSCRRAVVLFRAPDTESVRLACRRAALPFERVWACS